MVLVGALFFAYRGGVHEPPATTQQGTADVVLTASVAQTPTATFDRMETQTGLPGFVQFGFRVVLSGPTSSRAGEDITYALEYQRVSPSPKGYGDGVVIVYNLVRGAVPPQPAATLISVRSVVGAPPMNLIPQNPGFSENCEFGGDAGTLQIVVRPRIGFTGPLTVQVYVKGTSIEFPPGSVSEVTTRVM